ncbi:MAG TPA: DUF5985 family protein [Rudaea sp.]|nr:DUF5985 family protein [Rudaea sp.]HSC13448.1 DUF5985 family protein [Rhodanobacteraceae bacterium]
MFASLVYTLCAITALLCAILLLRAYRSTRSRVLLWSGLCFAGLMLANAVLVLDKIVYTEVDLSPWRHAITLVSLLMLLYGLIYAKE